MVNNNLIFDLGFHYGEDTDFYLAKGFHVVAVEANPELVRLGAERFSQAIRDGRLTLLHRAVAEQRGTVTFYVHRHKTEWSSCFRTLAESDGGEAIQVDVEAASIVELFSTYGVPRYMKVDIEGCDIGVARQLSALTEKPPFVSFETSRRDYAGLFAYLYVAGYTSYQLVNQMLHSTRNFNRVQKEGETIDYVFGDFSSGFFGEDLPADKWLSYEEALERYIKYKDLKKIDNQELGLGWLDLHARLSEI